MTLSLRNKYGEREIEEEGRKGNNRNKEKESREERRENVTLREER